MKGYTNVLRHDALKAMSVWRERSDLGKQLRDKAVDQMYHHEYTYGSWLTRKWHKNSTPIDFARSRMTGFFGSWSDVLVKYLTKEELEIVEDWEWGRGKAEYIAVKALVNSGYGELLMDNELCKWINKQLGRN